MKKIKLLLCCVLATQFISCKTIHEVLANSKFDNDIAIEELNRPGEKYVYPFTLNSEYAYGCPVIKYPVNNQIAYFLVDTGSPSALITDNGLKKFGIDPDEFNQELLPTYLTYLKNNNPKLYKKIKDNPKKALKQFKKDQKKGLNINNYDCLDENIQTYSYGQNYSSKSDGLLGVDFLKKYKRVTFDFIDNVIILDAERLEGNSTKMYMDETEHYIIEFEYNGKTELGLLDTGNYTFSPRTNFGKDEIHYDLKNINISYDILYKNTKKVPPFIYTFNNIKICGHEKNNIKGIYSNCWFSTYSIPAQEYLTKVNGLGCEFFKGHIIQFDFENMEFIMQ